MKVCLVNKFHWRKGGSETYYFNLAEALKTMGHEVACFAMDSSENEPCEQSKYFVSMRDYNGDTSLVKKLRDGAALIYSLEARRKFNDLLEEFQPDIIHLNLVHRQLTFSILDAPYLKSHMVPVVYTAHDYIPVCPGCTMLDGAGEVCDDCLKGSFMPCVRKRCVKGSRAKSVLAAAEAAFLKRHGSYWKIDRIIAPSEYMRAKLVDGGFPYEQVVAMQNFAKDEALDRARSTEDKTDRENPYVLYFGRLSKEKGVDVLIRAFLSISDEIPQEWRLVIAGEGPERAELEELLENHRSAHRIELVGFRKADEMRVLAERAALAIASSRWRENMPYSVIESFAAGTPVIASRIGGLPELVKEGGTGFLAEPGSVEFLAEALRRGIELCTDLYEYRAMQQRCRDYVVERCDQERYMSELVSLYESLSLQRLVAVC
ncbi:glycosyltransferase [Adlercreutzia sp. ZJ141]|uniref:glycosyltransferase n=1 Tax=Adlercreutzia sp. ZJ141 TaxID=2709406 RepID=UPI0013ECEB96|nr:glycosyltransferase [Adlercreutzia sp. ZJ141]